MSIRHYNPRRRRRGGISPKARNFLGALVALIILLQISYPLIEGEALRIVTIATVFVAAIAMVVHGHLSYGFKYSSRYLPIAYAFGLGIEVLGVHTGWPFGVYEYDASLGVQLFGVPLIVPCAWVMMVHPCLCAARRIALSRDTRQSDRRLGAAHRHLCRQGGLVLHDSKADHSFDQ
jgi:uncharacterized membrane protein